MSNEVEIFVYKKEKDAFVYMDSQESLEQNIEEIKQYCADNSYVFKEENIFINNKRELKEHIYPEDVVILGGLYMLGEDINEIKKELFLFRENNINLVVLKISKALSEYLNNKNEFVLDELESLEKLIYLDVQDKTIENTKTERAKVDFTENLINAYQQSINKKVERFADVNKNLDQTSILDETVSEQINKELEQTTVFDEEASQEINGQTMEFGMLEDVADERVNEVINTREPVEISVSHEDIPEEDNEQVTGIEILDGNKIVNEEVSEVINTREPVEISVSHQDTPQEDNEQVTGIEILDGNKIVNEEVSEVTNTREPVEISVSHEDIPQEDNEQVTGIEILDGNKIVNERVSEVVSSKEPVGINILHGNRIVDERVNEVVKTKEIEEVIIPHEEIVKFTYANNAIIKNINVYLTDELGNRLLNDAILKIGTRITVLHIDFNSQVVSIEYLFNNKVVKGFIKNDHRVIEYICEYNYTNGYMRTNVYNESDKCEKCGVLYPYEKATILYEENSKFCIVYDTEKGKNSKTGFISIERSRKRFTHAYNAVITNFKVALRDEKGRRVANKVFLNVGDNITVLWVDFNKQLALIEYLFNNEIRVGYIKNSSRTIKYLNEYAYVNMSKITPTYAISNGKRQNVGNLFPNEKFTILYEDIFGTYIIYDTKKGKNSKSAYIDLSI